MLGYVNVAIYLLPHTMCILPLPLYTYHLAMQHLDLTVVGPQTLAQDYNFVYDHTFSVAVPMY